MQEKDNKQLNNDIQCGEDTSATKEADTNAETSLVDSDSSTEEIVNTEPINVDDVKCIDKDYAVHSTTDAVIVSKKRLTLEQKKKLDLFYKIIAPIIFVSAFLLLWDIVAKYGSIPKMLIPTPAETVSAFFRQNKLIMYHTRVTLTEAICGLGAGVLVGFCIALLMDAFKMCSYGFKPLLVISQTIPTIVIAPILIMWMGFGLGAKVFIVTLTTFFPIAIGLQDGYASTDKDMIDLMRAMGAGKVKIFFFLKMPNALPNFFSSLKISTTYSIVAAVISEWVGAEEGLGYYIPRAQSMYKYDTMFAIIMWIIILSLILMLGIEILRKLLVKGKKE